MAFLQTLQPSQHRHEQVFEEEPVDGKVVALVVVVRGVEQHLGFQWLKVTPSSADVADALVSGPYLSHARPAVSVQKAVHPYCYR